MGGGDSYSTGQVREILQIQRVCIQTDYLTRLPEAEVSGLLTGMKRYPGIWPEDVVAGLEEISHGIRRKEVTLGSIHTPGPPSFHHAYQFEMEGYEEASQTDAERAAGLTRELAALRSTRKQMLEDIGL